MIPFLKAIMHRYFNLGYVSVSVSDTDPYMIF